MAKRKFLIKARRIDQVLKTLRYLRVLQVDLKEDLREAGIEPAQHPMMSHLDQATGFVQRLVDDDIPAANGL